MAKQRNQPDKSVRRLADLRTDNFHYMAAVIDWYGPYPYSPNDPEQFISTIVNGFGEAPPLLYAGFGMGEQPDQLQVIDFAEDAAKHFRELHRGEGQSDGGVQAVSSACSQYYLGWIKSQAIAGPQSRGRLYLYKFAAWLLASHLQPPSNNDSRDVPNHGGIVWSRWWDPETDERIPKPLQSWPDLLTCTYIEEKEDTDPRCRIQGVDLPPRE